MIRLIFVLLWVDDKLMLCITDVELSWAAELNRISILVLFLVIGGSVHQKV